MTLQLQDTVVDRVERVKRSLASQHQPGAARVTVDGLCPHCAARVVVEVRADSCCVECDTCGSTYFL